MQTSSHRTRAGVALSTALIAVGALGLAQQAHAQEPVTASSFGTDSLSTASANQPAPKHVPEKVLKQMRRQPSQPVKPRRSRPRARTAGWYDGGRVHATAHCILDYLNVDQPLVKALAGYTTQWVAIKADYLGSPGAYYSDWYYAIASQWGEFVGLTGGGRFMNARTSARTDSPGFLYKLLPSPSNVRMQVVWYGSGRIDRHIGFWFQTSDFVNCY